MQYLKKVKTQIEFIEEQTNNPELPLLVALENSIDTYLMSELKIIKMLGLLNVPGEQTEETNYINLLDELLEVYNNENE